MTSHRLRRLVAAAAFVLPLAGARAADGLEQVFPSGALFFATVDDLGTFQGGLEASPWGRLFADDGFDGLRDALTSLRDTNAQAFRESLGVDPFEMLAMIDGRIGFAVLAAADPERQEFDPDDDYFLSIGIVAGIGPEVDDFASAFDGLIDVMVEEDDDLVLKSEAYGDVDAAVVVDEEGTTLRYGFVDGHLVTTITSSLLAERDDFGALIDGVRGAGEDVLADDPDFSDSLASATLSGVRAWFDLASFLRLASAFDSDLAAMFSGLEGGLDEFGSLAVTFEVTASGLDLTASMVLPQTAEQASMLLDQHPLATTWMPPTVRGALALQVDWSLYYDQFIGGLMKQDPESARAVITGMGEFEEEYGFHPRDDLIDNLDGQLGLFVTEVDREEQLPLPIEDVPPFNLALVAGLHDGEALRTVIDDVVRKTGSHAARRREEFEGYTIDLVPLPGFVSIVYAVTDDLLVVSLAPSLVRDVLRRQGGSQLGSLATSKSYAAANARVPERRTFELSLQAADLGRLMLLGLHQMQEQQVMMQEWIPDAQPGWLVGVSLPAAELAAKYIKGTGLITSSYEDGHSLFRIAW